MKRCEIRLPTRAEIIGRVTLWLGKREIATRLSISYELIMSVRWQLLRTSTRSLAAA